MRRWQQNPPAEWRKLLSPLSAVEQGRLHLWVEIIAKSKLDAEPHRYPKYNIEPPPQQRWELRVICWAGRNLPQDVDLGDLADWYVKASIGNAKPQDTDTHLRAQRGKASWNWRFKFDVTLDSEMKYQRLHFQAHARIHARHAQARTPPREHVRAHCTLPLPALP